MNNRTTYILIACTLVILGAAVGIGAFISQPKPQPQPVSQQPAKKEVLPTTEELDTQLTAELPAISSVLSAAYPTIASDYIINRGKLYHKGEWYGTTLTYKGTDIDNRDTLRVLMQKKDTVWTIRSTPPQPLLTSKAVGDVPKDILKDINQPAPLPGTETSPAITPGE